MILAAGCGSDDSGDEEPAAGDDGGIVDISQSGPVGEMLAGSVASLVECRDWNGANEAQRLATIEDVRSQQNRREGGLREPELTDEEAADLFDNACEPDYAQGFRLYKLYAAANGFVEVKRALDE